MLTIWFAVIWAVAGALSGFIAGKRGAIMAAVGAVVFGAFISGVIVIVNVPRPDVPLFQFFRFGISDLLFDLFREMIIPAAAAYGAGFGMARLRENAMGEFQA